MIHKYSTKELVAAKPNSEEFHRLPRHPIFIVLDNLRSLENVGLFFRLADAIRAEKLFLTGITGYPRREKDARRIGIIERAERLIAKTAIQTIPFVPWEYHRRPKDVLRKLKEGGVTVVGLELSDVSTQYTEAKFAFPVAFVIGHERKGLSERVLSELDQVIHIPMYGMGNSHNSAISCAIVAYEALRRITALSPTLP